MNLNEIKQELGIDQLQFSKSTDAEGVVNPEWYRHWDNDSRISVSIHIKTIQEIQDDPDMINLGLQHEEAEGEQGPYDRYRIISYTKPELVL